MFAGFFGGTLSFGGLRGRLGAIAAFAIVFMTIFLTGWRAVIGGVEALPFKDDPDRGVDLAQGNLAANRANRQRVIGKMLKLVKTMTAFFAKITINRHFLTSPNPESL